MISCIVPVYNNQDTILHVLNVLLACKSIDEIIAVDDCSQDGSARIISRVPDVKTIFNSHNLGKGGAVVETMIKFLRLAKAMYEHLETVGPFFGKLDLWGVQGVILRTKAASGFEPGRWLETDLHLEPIELETIQEPVAAAKLILDFLNQK